MVSSSDHMQYDSTDFFEGISAKGSVVDNELTGSDCIKASTKQLCGEIWTDGQAIQTNVSKLAVYLLAAKRRLSHH